jgi:phospholipid/cholesterol/gamma-HCH transport system substrate-binding protein
MENRAHAIATGLFAILLSAAVVLALWWFSDKREATRELILVTSGSVNGLNPQATVRYRGIVAGRVARIDLDPDDPRKVLVFVRIRTDLPITHATRARLATQGVTGLAFIALDDPGDGAGPLVGDAPRIPLAPSVIEELTTGALQTLRQLRLMSERLATLTRPENLSRIENTLARIESSSRGLDQTLQETPRLVADLRRFLDKDNLERISRTLTNLERASAEAAPMAVEGRKLLVRLESASARLETLTGSVGEGLSASTLPRINGLVQELTTTSRQLSGLLDEVERSPQMLLLGRETPQPGPGEAGFKPPVR